MRRRESSRRWLAAVAFALLSTTAGAFLTPRGWLGFLLPGEGRRDEVATPGRAWLEILPPPPDVVAVPDPPRQPTPPPPRREPEPDWWEAAWRGRVAVGAAAETDGRAAAVLDSLRLRIDLLAARAADRASAEPDSALADRLLLLRREMELELGGLRPYLSAAGRMDDYRDLMSRVSAMYDEFLFHEISVPDADD